MIKYTALIIILVTRIIVHPLHTPNQNAPFTSQFTFSHPTGFPAKFLSLNGMINDNRVNLTWDISENETADLFEVEKSTDGKNFSLAALVFGTDKMNVDQYEFYETAGSTKVIYRIKLIKKNKRTEYSKTIEINPIV